MRFLTRFTEEAADDLSRLYAVAAENDPEAAHRAHESLSKAWGMLNNFPFSCRKAEGVDATLREIVMPCGGTGYVALCEIAPDAVVTVLAVRHHREDDYH